MPRVSQSRKRKRKRKSKPSWRHYAATRIQRTWVAQAYRRTCTLSRVYVPRDERMFIAGFVFHVATLQAYVMGTGDTVHPVTRQPFTRDTMNALGISARFAVRGGDARICASRRSASRCMR